MAWCVLTYLRETIGLHGGLYPTSGLCCDYCVSNVFTLQDCTQRFYCPYVIGVTVFVYGMATIEEDVVS